ncbi:hypothetical protein JI664_12880 [Rhodobacter sp. NTK016B]|uniref:hypothetical protein n=1 Tax=Rhodobacter sp. NTK016B TaxID=2759676 RepID=UPI001A8C93CB|nr:hypothetical protein [Rhodobacter sp. NTK016B]MBN8292862.1 hypothetical protein [Rhodobacter sp. NTK016B]
MTHPSRHVERPNPAAAQCWGKESFDSWDAAQRIITRKRTAQRLRGENMASMTVYRCQRCKRFHIAGVS